MVEMKSNRKERRASKDKIRQIFLGRLPQAEIAVEIGVWKGEFSSSILEYIQPQKLYLIDPWVNVNEKSHSNAFAGLTDNQKMEQIFNEVNDRYSDEIQSGIIEIIRDFSINALKSFDDGSIGFAYIDGDHSYEGVTADLNAIFPKMKVGGIMAFDDYHRRGWWGDGVIRAINEFLGKHPEYIRVRAIAGAQIALERISPLH